jgi:hypothetical protein
MSDNTQEAATEKTAATLETQRNRILEIIRGHRNNPAKTDDRRTQRLQKFDAPTPQQEIDQIKSIIKAEKEKRNQAQSPSSA